MSLTWRLLTLGPHLSQLDSLDVRPCESHNAEFISSLFYHPLLPNPTYRSPSFCEVLLAAQGKAIYLDREAAPGLQFHNSH